MAKCVKLYKDMKETEFLNKEKWMPSEIPLLAVPTTAGSGSESTRHAVVYKDGIKQSISHISILPDYVFLDGRLLAGLPEYQKKSTMLDALCQAIESCWSRRATDDSIRFSKESMSLIRDNWKDYMSGNPSAADNILSASNYSGRAIDTTTTTAAHAMSYGVTSRFKIPHGHAVALCITSVWKDLEERKKSSSVVSKRADFVDRLKIIDRIITYNDFLDMMDEMKMRRVDLAFGPEDIEVLTNGVNPERLGNHPVSLSKDDIRKMYKEMLINED